MKYLLPFLLLCAACLGEQRPLTVAGNYNAAMERALDSTVALVGDDGRVFCAGVAIESHVLTAAHCVADDAGELDEVSVAYRGSDSGDGTFDDPHRYAVAYFDADQDLAILNRLDVDPAPPPAPLSPSAPFNGQSVVTVGHPAGLTYTITDGLVSHERRVMPESWGGGGQVYFQISSPIYFGNSGGPVFNRYGEVLGLSSFLVYEPHLGGAVHWEVILAALGNYHATGRNF